MIGSDAGRSTVHASAVTIGEAGVLIRGASGIGKSALAFGLISARPGRCRLIADDRVRLSAHHGRLVAFAPAEIAGLIEVRGQGVVSLPYLSPAVIRLVVDMVAAVEAPRMPEQEESITILEGVSLPRLALAAGSLDGAMRVAFAAERLDYGSAGRR